jgi:putative membrane protein
MKAIGIFLRGLAMGISDIIPGISGGTIALITGIYAQLIASFSQVITFFKELVLWCVGSTSTRRIKRLAKRLNLKFLFSLLAGILVAIALGAIALTFIIARYEVYFLTILLGLIITSTFFLYKEEVYKRKHALLALGIVVGAVIAFLSPLQVTQPALWYVLIAGFLAISAMLLPGISGSFILLLLGVYAFMLESIRQLDLLILGVFAIGIIAGVLVSIRGIHWLLEHKQQSTLQLMLGFIIGSSLVPLRQIKAVYAGESLLLMACFALLACILTTLLFYKKNHGQ